MLTPTQPGSRDVLGWVWALPSLQSGLACRFTDAGGRHERTSSETEDTLLQPEQQHFVLVPEPSSHRATPVRTVHRVAGEKPALREPQSSLVSHQHGAPEGDRSLLLWLS